MSTDGTPTYRHNDAREARNAKVQRGLSTILLASLVTSLRVWASAFLRTGSPGAGALARCRAEVVGLLLPAATLRRKQLPFATLHLWYWALSAVGLQAEAAQPAIAHAFASAVLKKYAEPGPARASRNVT